MVTLTRAQSRHVYSRVWPNGDQCGSSMGSQCINGVHHPPPSRVRSDVVYPRDAFVAFLAKRRAAHTFFDIGNIRPPTYSCRASGYSSTSLFLRPMVRIDHLPLGSSTFMRTTANQKANLQCQLPLLADSRPLRRSSRSSCETEKHGQSAI
jgi:hypothetical protein